MVTCELMPGQRRILFLTGTRADFGKLKSLMIAVNEDPRFDCSIFVTGMHTLSAYGLTMMEVQQIGCSGLHVYMNQILNEPMDMVLANTVSGLARYVHENPPDMIIVHGDRVEAMAGAIVGAMRNILVGHIEGGELSGTVDELIRHATSKLSHIHFVANAEAAQRLRQMGEKDETVFVVGSPDIDVMVSSALPTLESVKQYYEITYDDYAIAMLHPVTTEVEQMEEHAAAFVDALLESGQNYVVIYPNNDEGTSFILHQYQRLKGNRRFRIFPSIRFESFLVLMKNARFIAGNSSAGIREAPFYGLPTVNVGTRQANRYRHASIIDVGYDRDSILAGIAQAQVMPRLPPSDHFGRGDSVHRFMEALAKPETWLISRQKQFNDLAGPPAAVS